jgi:hypothetical protein
MKTLPTSVAELQRENITFELESIDRIYLNAYVPQLTNAAGVASYFRNDKGHRFASIKDAVEMSRALEALASSHKISGYLLCLRFVQSCPIRHAKNIGLPLWG